MPAFVKGNTQTVQEFGEGPFEEAAVWKGERGAV